MSVCHITSVHSRFDTRIYWKECSSLASAGFDMSLIVADGNPEEVRGGVRIFSVAPVSGRLRRMLFLPRRVLGKALSVDADIFHLHDPELLTIARALKKAGKKVIFDAHEDLARQILLKKYLPFPLRRLVSIVYSLYEQHAVRVIDGVVTATEGQASGFRKSAKNIVVVENFSRCSQFPERELDFSSVRILHAGALTAARGLQGMTRLARALKEGDHMVLAGAIESDTDPSALSPAEYLGVIPFDQLMLEYEKANLGLILYNPVGQYGMATAVKLYEYMAAGLPVIVPDHGEWPDLVRTRACGIAVNVNDISAQLAAIEWVKNNPEEAKQMGRNGRRFAMESASWEAAFRKLENFYRKVLAS